MNVHSIVSLVTEEIENIFKYCPIFEKMLFRRYFKVKPLKEYYSNFLTTFNIGTEIYQRVGIAK